jgi:hypothetical protein
MPKASKDELGADVSGVTSRDTVETEASPYLILTEGGGRWSFLEPRGCRIKPSTAAQMRTLRAKLGIFQSWFTRCHHPPSGGGEGTNFSMNLANENTG